MKGRREKVQIHTAIFLMQPQLKHISIHKIFKFIILTIVYLIVIIYLCATGNSKYISSQ